MTNPVASFFRMLFRKQSPRRDARRIKCDGRYRNQLTWEFELAVTKLGNHIAGTRHTIRELVIVPGTDLRPKGWSVRIGTQWVGGWATPTKIHVVCNPHDGTIPRGYIAHEIAHALLDNNSNVLSTDGQHEIMKKVGLM